MITYELAKELKDAGFPQNEELLYCAEDFEGMTLRDTINAITRVKGQHLTFDYSVYPDPVPDDFTQGKARNLYYFSRIYLKSEDSKKYTVYVPTLSELIEACGNEFLELGKYKQTHIKRGKFWAFIHMDWYKKPIKWWKAGSTNKLGWQWRFRGEGSTPEEAVARLWLELNK